MSMGKSRIQATDHVNLQQVQLTGYEQFPQEIQTYPVSREPVTVQPTSHDNNSVLRTYQCTDKPSTTLDT